MLVLDDEVSDRELVRERHGFGNGMRKRCRRGVGVFLSYRFMMSHGQRHAPHRAAHIDASRTRAMTDTPASNSLGLNFDALQISDPTDSVQNEDQAPPPEEPAQEQPTPTKEQKPDKKKSYHNPERVKTGGPQRVCAQLPYWAPINPFNRKK